MILTDREAQTRFQKLQQQIGWTAEDAGRVRGAGELLAARLPAIAEEFVSALERDPETNRFISGGSTQAKRLQQVIVSWLRDFFAATYDANHVRDHRRIGRRHVEFGLPEAYTIAALARLRSESARQLREYWRADHFRLLETLESMHRAFDLETAIIADAYEGEYVARQDRVERLATIGQVAGGIAHELRDPLNVIKTSVYFLQNAPRTSAAKRAEHLSRIERQVILADGVITALSDFARLPVPVVQPFCVEHCLREVLETVNVPRSVDIHFERPAALPYVLADADQIRIAFANLIRNACDAMPDGGRLSIDADVRQGAVCVSIADTGGGIPAEFLGRIMEPLVTTKPRGIGLGLAMTRAIVDKNQGRLSVTSEPGKGATFTIQLRASDVAQSPGASTLALAAVTSALGQVL
jgi:signal transduction histidine kinase